MFTGSSIFGFEGDEADEVCISVFVNQIFTGFTSLKYYDIENGWIGDHVQSDFVVFRVLMENLKDFIQIEETEGHLRLLINRSAQHTTIISNAKNSYRLFYFYCTYIDANCAGIPS